MKTVWVAVSLLLPSALWAQTLDRVSLDSAGTQANALSSAPQSSTTGQFVVFQSTATNLVAGDTNGVSDVFVRDRSTGATTRVSVITGGGEANGASTEPSISADGRFITFTSVATNLVAGDTNAAADIFLHDRNSTTTTRVSTDAVGAQVAGASGQSFITPDGTQVVFTSASAALVAGDTNALDDIFLKNISTGAVTRISVSTAGVEANGASRNATVSGTGLFVVFTSDATNLVAGDVNGLSDIFFRSVVGSTTTIVSFDTLGGPTDGASDNAWISSDATLIVFDSTATDLVAGDANLVSDVFARNTVIGVTTRISIATAGTEANGASTNASPSSDGRFVSFTSAATNLIATDTNAAADIYCRDLTAGRTLRASTTTTSTESDGASSMSAMSLDGLRVMFESVATNLVAMDTNAVQDIFAAVQPLFPPTGGVVNDGTGADIDAQAVGTAVSANWSGFTANSSAIASFDWAYGTTPGGTDLQGLTNVGLVTAASNTTTLPSAGTTVFVSVRAIDVNGNTSVIIVSDGVLILAAADADISGGNNSGKCGISGAPFAPMSALLAALALVITASRFRSL